MIEKGRLSRRIEKIREEFDRLPDWEQELIGHKKEATFE